MRLRVEMPLNHEPGAGFAYVVSQVREQLGVTAEQAMTGLLTHVAHLAVVNDVPLSELVVVVQEAYSGVEHRLREKGSKLS